MLFFFLVSCLFFCVAGIGLGSSPTSSQNEALPPSTDWPVSAYTSSFSLSSPETDDAGTWFIHNPHLPHCNGLITANQHCPLPPVTLTHRASTIQWRTTYLIFHSSPSSWLYFDLFPCQLCLSCCEYFPFLLPPCVWHGKCETEEGVACFFCCLNWLLGVDRTWNHCSIWVKLLF